MTKTILLTAAFFCFLQSIHAQDGEPDQSFGNGGIAKTKFRDTVSYQGTAVQADGKIVVAGYKWNGKNYDFLVVRYNRNGSLDSTFSGNGKPATDFEASNDYGLCVAIQTDGKIVVAGSSNHRFALARYNANGSLDSTFSGDGKQIDNFRGSRDEARSAVIQKDGKIVVAGVAKDSFAVARYTINGSLDKSFSGDGLQTSNFGNGFYYSEYANAATIQKDNKIVVVGTAEDQFALARYNTDGTADASFSDDGKEKTRVEVSGYATSVALQSNGKIIVSGTYSGEEETAGYRLFRYNTNGSIDETFKDQSSYYSFIKSIAVQPDGKIVGGGSSYFFSSLSNIAVFRFNKNGTPDSSFNNDGVQVTQINEVSEAKSIAIAGNRLYAAGGRGPYQPYNDSVEAVAAYFLDNSNKAPAVSLSVASNTLVYTAPAGIKLNATASDENGTIKKVEFYNGTTLIHTETASPYGYLWKNVPEGEYMLTAKAYDNDGFSRTSNTINVSVVYNQPPVVKIVSPVYDTSYTAPASIKIIAEAKDPDGYITKVKFFAENVETRVDSLLTVQYKYPYEYTWKNVQAGTYYITAFAEDNKGYTTRYYTTIRVNSPAGPLLTSRPSDNKIAVSDEIDFKLFPNPAGDVVTIQTSGLLQNKPATLSIILTSGIVLKTMQISSTITQLDVSSLASGVYTLKIISEDKVVYKQFVKL